MQSKVYIFEDDDANRFQPIEASVQSLRSGNFWSTYGNSLGSWSSLYAQLRQQRRNLSKPEQELEKQKLLLLTSHDGKWGLVDELIKMGIDPNCRLEGSGSTPLQLAAHFGHPKTCQYLLSAQSIDINAVDDRGNTVLMYASQRGCHAVIEVLLKRPELNVSASNSRGFNALDFAIAHGNYQVVRHLHTSYPDMSMQHRLAQHRTFYEACCFEACENGWLKSLKYLVEHGVSIKIRRPESNADLVFTACLFRQERVLTFLIRRKSLHPDRENRMGATPLFAACESGDLATTKLLCEENCNINRQDKQGLSPAYMATVQGHKDVVLYLRSVDCNMKVKTNAGDTLLHAAIDSGKSDLFCIIAQNLTLRATVNNVELAHRAASKHAVEIFEKILEWDANLLDVEDNEGNTPLLYACRQRGCLSMLLFLESRHANFRCANRRKKTPALRLASLGECEPLKVVRWAGGYLDHPDWKGVTPMLRAAELDHMGVVEFLVKDGRDFNKCDSYGRTAAYHAAVNNDKAMLELLDKYGANLDVETNEQITPLFAAAQRSHLDIVKFLLEKGLCRVRRTSAQGQSFACCSLLSKEMLKIAVECQADFQTPDANGNNAVINACSQGDDQICILKALKNENCNLDERNKDGESGVYLATRHNFSKILRYLLKSGCEFNAWNKAGKTPFLIAAEFGHDNALDILYQYGCDQHARSISSGQNALHLACAGGHWQCVRFLLLIECDAWQTDKDGATPLMLACKSGSRETVKCLLRKYRTESTNLLRILDKRLQSCVHYAAMGCSASIIRLLAKRELPMDAANVDGETPLILAASGGSCESLKFLLERCHASVAKVDVRGQSALHRAAAVRSLDCLEELHTHIGENACTLMNRADKRGMTPLLLAAANGHVEVFTFLRDKYNDPEILKMVTKEGESCLTLLLRKIDCCEELVYSMLSCFEDSDRLSETQHCNAAMLTAASQGRMRALRCLVKHPNCRLNAVDNNGNSALHLTAGGGHYECREILLETEDLTAFLSSNKHGQNALHMACTAGSWHGVCTLLQRPEFMSSSMVDRQDVDGNTPLMCAILSAHHRQSSFRIVKSLLRKGACQDIRNKNGHTACWLAFLQHREDIIGLMEVSEHSPLYRNMLEDVVTATGNSLFIRDTTQGAIKAKKFAFFRMLWSIVSAVEATVDLIGPCSDGAYILHACVLENLKDVASFLIYRGCHVDSPDGSKQTAFLSAIKHNMTEMAKWLYTEFSCDIHLPDSDGTNALMAAISMSNYDLVDWLLGLRDPPKSEYKDQCGRNYLHLAVKRGSWKLFCRLLCTENGTKLAVMEDNDFVTPIQLAARQGETRMLAEVINKGFRDLLNPRNNRSSLLLVSSASGLCSQADWLYNLVFQPPPVHDHRKWVACLSAACASGHLKMLQTLASKSEGLPLESGIFLAAGCSGSIAIADYLMRCLPSEDLRISDLLMAASAYDHINLIRHLILHYHAPIDKPDRWGNQPCHVAAVRGHIITLRWLLKNQSGSGTQSGGGTQLHEYLTYAQPNSRGRSLLDLAIANGNTELVTELCIDAVPRSIDYSSDVYPAQDTKKFYEDFSFLRVALETGELREIYSPPFIHEL